MSGANQNNDMLMHVGILFIADGDVATIGVTATAKEAANHDEVDKNFQELMQQQQTTWGSSIKVDQKHVSNYATLTMPGETTLAELKNLLLPMVNNETASLRLQLKGLEASADADGKSLKTLFQEQKDVVKLKKERKAKLREEQTAAQTKQSARIAKLSIKYVKSDMCSKFGVGYNDWFKDTIANFSDQEIREYYSRILDIPQDYLTQGLNSLRDDMFRAARNKQEASRSRNTPRNTPRG